MTQDEKESGNNLVKLLVNMNEQPTGDAQGSHELSQPMLGRVREVMDRYRMPGVEEREMRYLPAIALHAYRFFGERPNPTADEERAFQDRCLALREAEERDAILANPLCTVGAELEGAMTEEMRELLLQLGVATEEEADPVLNPNPTQEVWEIPAPWTYSGEVQAAMLHDAIALRAIAPLLSGAEGQEFQKMALHLNFATPKDVPHPILESEEARPAIEDLNDALILAFTSRQRLLERPTPSFSISKEASESQKTQRNEAEQDVVVDQGLPTELPYRLELRAFEYTEDTIDPLLFTSQHMTTALFQWMRQELMNGRHVEAGEEAMVRSFVEGFQLFRQEVAALRKKYGILRNFADGDKEAIKELYDKPENAGMAGEFRALVDRYGAYFADFLDPSDEA